MGNDDELRLVRHLANRVVETADVGFVKRGVDLVKHAERRRLDQEDGEKQRHRCEGLLTAGEQLDVLQHLLAWRICDDLDASLQHVALVGERKVRLATPEKVRKDLLEFGVDGVEHVAKTLAGGAVDLVDRRLQAIHGRFEIRLLSGQEIVTPLQFLRFLDGR